MPNNEISDEPPLSAFGREFYFNVSNNDWYKWQWHFKNRIKNVDQLHSLLNLPEDEFNKLKNIEKTTDLHISITPYYLSLINKNNIPNDPIYKQAVPSSLEYSNDGCKDPLHEDVMMPVEGLVHRYPDRVLFLTTNICSMNCRFCSRRREWEDGYITKTKKQMDAMLEYIRKTPTIRDVVLSGGDPLSISESNLEYLLYKLRQISHVEIIRIGTRYPVVLPMRITDSLVDMLSKYTPIWLNTHFNCIEEITPDAAAACKKILTAGIPVNNQSVLLKDVNDGPEQISALCKKLLTIGVRPYYIYRNDNTSGTEHFTTSIRSGIDIIDKMRGFISGLAIPTFVIDSPEGKIPLSPDYIVTVNDNEIILRNYEGKLLKYSA